MLAELIKELRAGFEREQATQVTTHSAFPGKALVRAPGMEPQWVEAPPAPRAHRLHGVGDLVAMAADPTICKAPEVYVAHDAVVLVLDRHARKEYARVDLIPTERFKKLLALTAGAPLSVPDAVRMIRFDLWGVGADALIATLRRVDFTRTGMTTIGTEHGRESLGKSVEAAVQAVDQIPQTFTVEVQVYANSGARAIKVRVTVGVHVDTVNQCVVLRPLADQIGDAVEAAQAELAALLGAKLPGGTQVFRGSFGLIG